MILKTQNSKLKTKNRGFSLVEMLVATSILIISIVGPMTLVSKGVFFSNYAKDQISAFYLAQEAVEYLRNVRDNNNIAGGTWNTYKTSLINLCMVNLNANGCKVDIPATTISSCNSPTNCGLLNRNDTSGLYSYQAGVGWVPTQFERRIKVYNEPTSDPNSNEIHIEVEMVWTNGTLVKNFIIKENLFAWQ
ncbi:MAG: prepilin-type N-terminal cleavage/methylation domain-containing protein [Patescibacteria group bacterium]